MARHLLALLFALSAVASVTASVLAWRRRYTTTACRLLAGTACGTAIWSLAELGVVLAGAPDRAMPVKAAIFPGVCLGVASTFCLLLSVTDRSWILSRRTALLLAVEPALTMVATATNGWHHLFIAEMTPGPLGVAAAHYGPLFWVHVAYSNIILTVGGLRLIQAWWKAQAAHRRVLAVTLIAVIPPFATNAIVLQFPERLVDVTVIAFSLSAVGILWGLVHRWFTELIPVARQWVLDTIEDAVIVVDPAGRILDLNPSADRLARLLMGDRPGDLTGYPVSDVLGEIELADAEFTRTDARGRGVDLNVRISGLYDRRRVHLGWTLVARDVTELHRRRRDLERANDQLRDQLEIIEALRADLAEQAVRDALTGLYNRRYLMESLAAPTAAPFAVVLLDIDHFKQINDGYGHAAGDDVLRHVAGVLRAAARDGDIVARHGGEEFVLVLRDVSLAEAHARVDALRERVSASPVDFQGRRIPVTFSAGVAGSAGPAGLPGPPGPAGPAGLAGPAGPAGLAAGFGPAELLQAADDALYSAKRNGRNRVESAGRSHARSAA